GKIPHAAARRFAELGCSFEERDPGWPDPYDWHKVIYEVSIAGRTIDRAAERPEWIEPSLMAMIEDGRRLSAIEHSKALLARGPFYDQARRFFETCDLLLTPQMPLAAWSADPDTSGVTIDGRPAPTIFERVPFMYPFNLPTHPGACVPRGFPSGGLPVALQIVGRWHADSTVLRAAACFEAIQPWADKRPNLE